MPADIDFEALFAAAAAIQKRAYAPYSRFKVGAALLADDGTVHAGCNVENAAYPVGSCAEAGAIAAMIAAGGRAIRAVLVFGEGAELVTPCGACRQRIREFALDRSIQVIGVNLDAQENIRDIHICALDEILPYSFGPEYL